jgi:hypothetical protein
VTVLQDHGRIPFVMKDGRAYRDLTDADPYQVDVSALA